MAGESPDSNGLCIWYPDSPMCLFSSSSYCCSCSFIPTLPMRSFFVCDRDSPDPSQTVCCLPQKKSGSLFSCLFGKRDWEGKYGARQRCCRDWGGNTRRPGRWFRGVIFRRLSVFLLQRESCSCCCSSPCTRAAHNPRSRRSCAPIVPARAQYP